MVLQDGSTRNQILGSMNNGHLCWYWLWRDIESSRCKQYSLVTHKACLALPCIWHHGLKFIVLSSRRLRDNWTFTRKQKWSKNLFLTIHFANPPKIPLGSTAIQSLIIPSSMPFSTTILRLVICTKIYSVTSSYISYILYICRHCEKMIENKILQILRRLSRRN